MALYTVTYDLRNRRDYETVTDELKRLGGKMILESTWALKANDTTAVELRDHFLNFIDSDDGLFVAEVTSWASHKTVNTPKDI